MKHPVTLLNLLVLPAVAAFAADAADPRAHAAEDPTNPQVSLDELRVPVFPAFSLLGVTPTDVERPSTARAFAVGLLSASERSGGDLPTNLAVEVAPYWWSHKPDLTFEKYYDADISQRIKQSFAVSLATAELSTYLEEPSAAGTAVSIGARAMILGGKKNPELDRAVTTLRDDLQAFVSSDCVPFADASTAPGGTSGGAAQRVSTLDLSPECEAKLKLIRERSERVTAFDRERVGLVLEAAAGAVAEIPDNDDKDRRTSKYGGWLTWSYRGSNPDNFNDSSAFTVVALQRWLRDDISDSDAFDVGARVIYKSKANQWAVSGEYLKRFADETPDSTSSRITLEYILSERYTLTAAIGRGFRNGDRSSPLIAIAGISLGWGGAKMKPR